MADPQTLTGAATGAAASLGTLVLGAQVDALVVGLMAAFFASIWMEGIDSKVKAAAAVLLSAMLAAYASPVLAGYIASSVSGVEAGDALRLLLALVIGAAAPRLIPLAIRRAGGKVEEMGR